MWMQDKPLLHEELADRLCNLGDYFTNTDQHILYLDTFMETIAREWYQVDRWRVDKFMMLFRRFFRHALSWLKSKNWDDDIYQRLTELYSKTVLATAADSYPEELQCHFASIYLDELDAAGVFSLSDEKIFPWLDVYIKLLSARISSLYFRSIENEIFDAIMVDFAENACPKPKPDRRQKHVVLLDPVGSSEALKIDYVRLADALFEAGKSKSLTTNRRKTIYNLAKQYRAAASGQNPFRETIDIPDDIDDEELDKAALKFLKWNTAKSKKRKRKNQEDEEVTDASDEDDESEDERPVRKRNMKKKRMAPHSPKRKRLNGRNLGKRKTTK